MLKAKEGEREELLKLKQNQEQYYNRTAQDPPDLKMDMKVYVQLQPQSRDWKPGTILECLDYNKFRVQIDFNGKEYIRNHVCIRPRSHERRRSQRTISRPNKYQNYDTDFM